MSIGPIGFPLGGAAGAAGLGGVTSPLSPLAPSGVGSGVSAASGTDFGNALTNSLEQVQALQSTSEDLALKAATGDLRDVHDYTIAATQAAIATELTVAMRNKAVEAFTEIMRMPL